MPSHYSDDYSDEVPRYTANLAYRDSRPVRHEYEDYSAENRPDAGDENDTKYGHPKTRRYLNPDTPISVLVIGPSQNGKTTFINRLISMAANENVEMGREGDKNGKCTVAVTEYDLEVPTSDYTLVDKGTRQDFEVPDIAMDEEKLLNGNRWKKMTSQKYHVRLRNPDAPYLRLHLIDTPGLDDSEGKDYENMEDVLGTLNRLSQADEAWKRQLNAIVLVYNANNAFCSSFQSIIRHYHQCMPNLFGTMAVVNTHFDLVNLSQKRAHLIREKLLNTNTGDSARRRILKGRADDFKKLHGQGLSPTHFFIDNRPTSRSAYAELLSRNTISDILMYLRSSMHNPMPIKQMRLVKSREMQTVDAKLQRGLEVAISRWEETLNESRDNASEREAFRSEVQQHKESLANAIARCKTDLDCWDNDTRFTINSYMTADNPSAAGLFFKGTIFRQSIAGTLPITEADYEEFWVATEDGPTGSWGSYNFTANPRKWVGTYTGKPGKAPNLLAKSWTTNRVKYKDQITRVRRELRGFEATLDQKEVTWKLRFDKLATGQTGAPKTETDRKLEELVSRIETSKHLVEILSQKSPPMDTGFNVAARKRYAKLPTQIRVEDLYDFVRAASLEIDLLKPLRQVGLEDYDL
ncbi:hypothetical protein B0H66DRAFT_42662 [Apodospora peruviana]|uniref:Dynamin N-terminal domain-containing protein n=1 Tax=Apodospora peruviana TaxID=516989 RepID=A0AAE0IS22_9PEZI|nr:hypothetical protein B0H66DRAFT_42662 [Apodospora peruviana]